MPFDIFPVDGTALPKDSKGKNMNGWLINLDEFNSASQSTMAAAYKLVLDRQVGNYDLHPKVYIMAAGNLESDNAIVNEMSSALISRFSHWYIRLDHKEWMIWATEARVDMRIRAYLGFKPKHLYTFNPDSSSPYSCPRTWELTSRAVGSTKLDNTHLPLLASLLGQGVATEFLAFIKLYSELPSMADIEANPETVKLSGRIDIQWALMGMVTQHVNASNATNLVKFLKRLSMELQVCAMREIMVTDQNLLENELSDWLMELSAEIYE